MKKTDKSLKNSTSKSQNIRLIEDMSSDYIEVYLYKRCIHNIQGKFFKKGPVSEAKRQIFTCSSFILMSKLFRRATLRAVCPADCGHGSSSRLMHRSIFHTGRWPFLEVFPWWSAEILELRADKHLLFACIINLKHWLHIYLQFFAYTRWKKIMKAVKWTKVMLILWRDKYQL